MKNHFNTRRQFIASTALGSFAFSVPTFAHPFQHRPMAGIASSDPLHSRYPALDEKLVSEVVGKSHFDLDAVKNLVNTRPELARAAWDWGFGDFESALGAASHVGRRDIALFLMEKGARADIFTFAMLGKHEVVKGMVEASPGIQTVSGPHGLSLLHHAEVGLEMQKEMTQAQVDDCNRTIDYLIALGNAGAQENYPEMNDADKEKYLGDYRYGEGEKEGFTIRLNRRKHLSLGVLGGFGGTLYLRSENRFAYQGAPSVEVSFLVENGKVQSLTVHEPGTTLTARKVS